MSRTAKNLIHFLIIGLALVGLVCSICFSTQAMGGPGQGQNAEAPAGSQNQSQGGMQGGQGGSPPEKPSGEQGGGQGGMQGGTPPEMPSGSQGGGQGGMQGGTPPEMPNGTQGGMQGGAPPDMPNGTQGGMQGGQGGTPPEKPSGEQGGMQGGGQGNMKSQQANEIPKDNFISQNRIIFFIIEALLIAIFAAYLIMSRCNKLTFKETFKTGGKKFVYVLLVAILGAGISGTAYLISDSMQKKSDPGAGQAQTANTEYNAQNTFDSDIEKSNEKYNSTSADELAVLVKNKAKVTLKNIISKKTGSSDGGDNTSFYGTNSAITAIGGSSLNVEDGEIETDATGANGLFCFGGSLANNSSQNDGTNVTARNIKITTKQDNSGGIMTTGGGIFDAFNLIINTFGTSSAAIRSDRGGGTVNVDGGTYTTNGKGSPSIYSTADINVKNAELVATASEGVVIEGKNSVSIENCELKDNNSQLNGQSTTYKNIFLYQSMSGDSAEGQSVFSAKSSKISTQKGDAFYVTNTKAQINLEDCDLGTLPSDGNFLRIQKDS